MEIQNIDKSICNIVSTGSHGNAVLYYNSILVDIGVPFKLILPYLYDIQIVLLTHEHFSDHLNLSALERLQFERPGLRIGTPLHMLKHVDHLKNLDVYEAGRLYDYESFQIKPVSLFHDVLNFGYKIYKDGYKIFHATDTSMLTGITAPDFQLYCIESNYDEETIEDRINEKNKTGAFCYEAGAANTHLSRQQCDEFYLNNKGKNSQLIRLHESKHNS